MKVIERIDEIISKIEMERENLGENKFDEGFDCGTQLALDLLEEWKDEFEEDCPVCHGAGATTDHHDPCTECGGTGKVGGEVK